MDEPQSTHGDRRPSRVLRSFDLLLRAIVVVFAAVTLLFVVLLGLSLTGRGSITLDSKIEPPYAIRLSGDRSIEVDASGRSAVYSNFSIGDEKRYLSQAPTVHAKVKIDRDDTDARIALTVMVGALLALAWGGLINLRRVVGDARAGAPFDRRNPARLRWLAATVLALPVVTAVMYRVLDATLDVDPPVHLTTTAPSPWLFLVAGLGLLVLAEVFAEGSELRELEQATI